jgi:hypothetical protein
MKEQLTKKSEELVKIIQQQNELKAIQNQPKEVR